MSKKNLISSVIRCFITILLVCVSSNTAMGQESLEDIVIDAAGNLMGIPNLGDIKGAFNESYAIFAANNYDKAMIYYNNGYFELALPLINKSIEHWEKVEYLDDLVTLLGNGPSMAYNLKGVILNELDRYQEAINYFDQAIEINPENKYAWVNKGNANYNLGNYKDTIKYCTFAIAIDPSYGYAYTVKNMAEQALQSNTHVDTNVPREITFPIIDENEFPVTEESIFYTQVCPSEGFVDYGPVIESNAICIVDQNSKNGRSILSIPPNNCSKVEIMPCIDGNLLICERWPDGSIYTYIKGTVDPNHKYYWTFYSGDVLGVYEIWFNIDGMSDSNHIMFNVTNKIDEGNNDRTPNETYSDIKQENDMSTGLNFSMPGIDIGLNGTPGQVIVGSNGDVIIKGGDGVGGIGFGGMAIS